MTLEKRVWTLDELVLANKVKLGRGNIISKRDIARFPGEYPIYSSAREKNGTFGHYGNYMFDEELITWSIDGGGRLFYRPRHKFSVTNVGGILRILDKDFLDCRYLHLVLTHLHSKMRFDWVYKAHPSVIRMVYKEIPIPSLEKQLKIVEKLDTAFAEIDLFEQNLELEEQKANQFLRSLLSSEFASCFDESNFGKLLTDQGLIASCKHELVRLGNLCISISGLWTGKKPPFQKTAVIRNTNFTKDCKLDLSNVATLDVETKQLQTRTLIPGDLIVEKSGGGPKQAVGRVVLFNEAVGTFSLSNFTSALRVKDSNRVLPAFLQYFLYHLYLSGATEAMQSNSTGIRNLNMHKFLDIEVPLPPLASQQQLVEKLDSALAEIEQLRSKIFAERDCAVVLRQSFLSHAFRQQESVA